MYNHRKTMTIDLCVIRVANSISVVDKFMKGQVDKEYLHVALKLC